MNRGGKPRFVKQYADLRGILVDAARRYADEVRGGSTPTRSTPTAEPVSTGRAGFTLGPQVDHAGPGVHQEVVVGDVPRVRPGQREHDTVPRPQARRRDPAGQDVLRVCTAGPPG